MKILIVTASYGTGHNTVARALAEEWQRQGHETAVVQLYGYNPRKVEAKNRTYLRTCKYIPKSYDFFWSRITARVRTVPSRSLMATFRPAAAYLEQKLAEFQPDRVFCTQVYCGAAMVLLKRAGKLREGVKVYSLLTDYYLHPYWETNNELDGVFVPHESLVPLFLERGYRREQVLDYGFPTAARFCRRGNRKEAKRELGLTPDAFVVLLLSGGNCVSSNLRLVRLLAGEPGMTVVAVNGHNEREKERIDRYWERRSTGADASFCLVNRGYVDNLDRYVDAADVVLSRGGGGTLSELLCKGAAIVLREKLITQERENAKLLAECGAARVLRSAKDAPAVVRTLRERPEELAALREGAERFARPDALARICATVLA